MIFYRVLNERLWDSDAGTYTAYGIAACRPEAGAWKIIARISDVFLRAEDAEHFAAQCNRQALSLVHFRDVVEDAVEEGEGFVSSFCSEAM